VVHRLPASTSRASWINPPIGEDMSRGMTGQSRNYWLDPDPEL